MHLHHKVIFIFLVQIILGTNQILCSQVFISSNEKLNYHFSLNGKWDFKYYSESIPTNDSLFFLKKTLENDWSKIIVPGNWELQGFSKPTYARNPLKGYGLYQTHFNIPKSWKNQPIYIAFDGVQSGYTFWVNGKYAGEFNSSYNRASFNITHLVVKNSSNTLSVKVSTHTRAYEFDTNDDWILMGIFRDVTLFSLPETHFDDFTIKTRTGTPNSNVNVEVIVESKKIKSVSEYSVECQLKDKSGNTVIKQHLQSVKKNDGKLLFTGEYKIHDAKLWTAEQPNLYTLTLSLFYKKKLIQQHTEKTGIRDVDWQDGVLKLNGKPIKLKGINYHNLSPVNGRAISEKELLNDLRLMKAANINFIRTAHYPPNYSMLEMCDSMGFYVMDEIPFGFGDALLDDPTVLPLLKSRAKYTVARDKNRPCVIAWSVGNENHVSENGLITGRYVKSLDNTRPYCFPQTPSVFRKMIGAIPDSLDLLDVHYPPMNELNEYANQFSKPLILGEFSHALGLDMGSLERYFDVINRSPKIAGGAVWLFADQGIARKAQPGDSIENSELYVWKDSISYFDTGGNQGADGIVYSNRVPQVDYHQLRKVYSPVIAIDNLLTYNNEKSGLDIKLINCQDFLNLSEFACNWELTSNNKSIHSGRINVYCLPHDTVAVTIPLVASALSPAQYNILTLKFTNKKGTQVYEKNFRIEGGNNAEKILSQLQNRSTAKTHLKNTTITSDYFQLRFITDSNSVQLKNKNNQIIISDFFARVGRKPTMASIATTTSKRTKDMFSIWTPHILKSETSKIKTLNSEVLVLQNTYTADTAFTGKLKEPNPRSMTSEIQYTVNMNGVISVNYKLEPKGGGVITESGLSLLIPSILTEFRWVGKGPFASYPGKNKLSEFGIYYLNSNDLYFPGNRQEVDCAVFTDKQGNGFALISDGADISVERNDKGLVVSHNAITTGCYDKYIWPADIRHVNSNTSIEGELKIVPLSANMWPEVIKDLFIDLEGYKGFYQPYFRSYDN